MDGLELYVRQSRSNQYRQSVFFGMEEALERTHAIRQSRVRRRNERRIARPRASNPVLGAAKLPGHLVASPPLRQQHAVNLANQPIGQRKVFPQSVQSVLQGRNVKRDFNHIHFRDAGRCFQFKEQQVRKRRLSPLDLGRQNRLFAYVGVDQQILIR